MDWEWEKNRAKMGGEKIKMGEGRARNASRLEKYPAEKNPDLRCESHNLSTFVRRLQKVS